MDGGWKIPETPPPLGEGEVQLWRIRIAENQELVGQALAWLTDDERARAARMRSVKAREEFVVGRGCLRKLLRAGSAKFDIGAHGKPQLPGGGVDFNVAHSGGVVMIALSRAGAVGVDIERMDRAIEVVEVARTAFHLKDVEWIASAADRVSTFYCCWARREAVGKADGRGLLLASPEFSVAGDAKKELRIVVGESRVEIFVRDIDAGEGFCAAVAIMSPTAKVQCFELKSSL
jgi:4'-phosphopantetheinyl transferase